MNATWPKVVMWQSLLALLGYRNKRCIATVSVKMSAAARDQLKTELTGMGTDLEDVHRRGDFVFGVRVLRDEKVF